MGNGKGGAVRIGPKNRRAGTGGAPPPPATVGSILAARPTTSFRWLKDYSLGVWLCANDTGAATVDTPANQPAVGTLPSGQTYPLFDGAIAPNYDFLTLEAWATAPPFSPSNHAAMGFIVQSDVLGPGGGSFVFQSDNFLYYVNGEGKLAMASAAWSNDPIVGTGLRRAITVKDGETGLVTLYMEGAPQALSTVNDSMDIDWNEAHRLGERDATGDYRLQGALGSMFLAIDTTAPFTASDIAALDAALAALL